MSFSLFLKAVMVWFIMAIFAILNGISREKLLNPNLGDSIALPLSGITLSLLIFALTYLFFNFLGQYRNIIYLYIGIQWVTMTLTFEFIFGHYVIGKSWVEIVEVFNIFEGNLFILALLVSLLSPLLVSYMKK